MARQMRAALSASAAGQGFVLTWTSSRVWGYLRVAAADWLHQAAAGSLRRGGGGGAADVGDSQGSRLGGDSMWSGRGFGQSGGQPDVEEKYRGRYRRRPTKHPRGDDAVALAGQCHGLAEVLRGLLSEGNGRGSGGGGGGWAARRPPVQQAGHRAWCEGASRV
jgi:hypothetical protein